MNVCSIALLSACFASSLHTVPFEQEVVEASAPRPHLVSMAKLPTAIASFGAIRLGDWIYFAGGHIGEEHAHSFGNLSSRFARFHISDPATIENLPGGVALQGFNLAADEISVIRAGGLFAKNDDPFFEELVSVRGVDRFDPATQVWSSLPALPEARSSHDILVVDNVLYVIGGWQLNGDEEPAWHDHGWSMDLGADALSWTKLPTPFKRRALSIGHIDGTLVATGGLTDSGRPSSETELYDIATGVWSDGPDFPGWGFGTATTNWNGQLCVSGFSGDVWGLSQDTTAWELLAKVALPRFFHRLLPGTDGLLSFGGATRDGHTGWVEQIELRGIASMRVDLPATLGAVGDALTEKGQTFIVGADGAGYVNLLSGAVESVPTPAVGFDTYRVLASPTEKDVSFAFGALGRETSVLRYTRGDDAWATIGAQSDLPLTGFAVGLHGDQAYMLGGTFKATAEEASASVSDRVFVSNAAMDTRFLASDMTLPEPRRAFAATVFAGELFVIGGLGAEGKPALNCHSFNFESGQWSAIPAAPRHRVAPQAVAVGTTLYVFGGRSDALDGALLGSSLDAYDTEAGTWSTVSEELPFEAADVRIGVWGERLIFQSIALGASEAVVHIADPRTL